MTADATTAWLDAMKTAIPSEEDQARGYRLLQDLIHYGNRRSHEKDDADLLGRALAVARRKGLEDAAEKLEERAAREREGPNLGGYPEIVAGALETEAARLRRLASLDIAEEKKR